MKRSPASYALLVSVLGCAGASTSAPQKPAPAAAVPVSRSLRYVPGTTRYRVVSHAHQEQQIEGNKQEGNFLLEYFLTVTLSQGPEQRLEFGATIDSLRAEGGLINAADLNRAKGARLTGEVSPTGEINRFTGDSLLTGQMQAVASSIHQFLPRIPVEGAEPGRQWTDTVETKTSGSPALTLRSVSVRKAGDWSGEGPQKALPIDVTSDYTLTGTGQQMGQEFSLKGTGQRVTRQGLSAQGRYVGASTRDSSTVTISLTSMGMSFPSTQIRNDTVSVVP